MYGKLVSWALRVAVVAVTATPPLFAQNATSGADTQAEGRQRPTPDQVMQILSSKLQLTEDQKARIAPIIADRQQQLRSLRENTSLRRRQKARKMKSIVEESDKKINAVLTSTQRSQYAQLKEQFHEQMRDRRANGSNE